MEKENLFSENATAATEMGACPDRATLRQRLANRLREVIGNPVIEEKELAAFDIVMGRRDVLKLGRNSLVVAGLVSAGVPPTVWARRDPSLGVHPCEVGLTPAEQASVTKAVDVSIGTELFQQTIYAEPVVSPQASATHAVIEGARHRYRLQSALDSLTPTEAQFLDSGHHWGPAELVQLEETENGWELAHYRHPWSAREDGATTDGLVRDVIMTAADGLSNPVKVLTISSPYNNFVTADGMSGAAYIIVVIDRDADAGGYLCVGTGKWAMTAPSDAPPEYPVEWKSMGLPFVLRLVTGSELWWDDKYVDMGHTDATFPAEYIPAKSTEHIVLYYPNGPRVITLADNGTPGYAYLWIDMLIYPLAGQPKPTFQTTPKLIHLQTNTDVPASGVNPPYRTDWLVFASNTKNSDGTYEFTTLQVGHDGSTQRETLDIWPEKGIYGRNQQYQNAYQNPNRSRVAAPPGGVQFDYSHMFNVHSFYGTFNDGFVKLAHFQGIGLAVFLVASDGETSFIAGHFPLAVPDDAGIGEITNLSGGVSKFDGFRFMASDANGNLFLMRHRRAVSPGTPYSAPIYGFNDADGNPKLNYNYTDNDPFPTGIDANSNLYTLDEWIAASNMGFTSERFLYRNILLNAALAFATDDTVLSQASWLGNTFQAAYAPRRFPFDSAYIVVQRAQGGSDTDYSAYYMHNNMVTKTWHKRQIATQALPRDPGLNESGDHYHATVTPVNAYGRPVSMLSADNVNLVIEVRADAPTTVVDDTHNLYYDIDRYTSFMAAPDPASGQLAAAVKAESFGLVLYARLVDTSSLTPSLTDTAMLATTGTTYPWQSANLAAQAQQRMGNDGSDTVALLGDAAPLADTTQYISGDSLTAASTQGSWDFKGGFNPSGGNSGNLGSLATYLNTSGQTMVGASFNLSLAASPDGVTIDPLTAVTAPAPGVSGGARFTYPTGTVTPATAAATLAVSYGELGGIWSSISHALHDALHWLQNVEAEVYNDLAEGAVELVVDVDSITAVVSADIMKAVNGVGQELNEVVSSVEEYASVVANVITTIVEQSFLYQLIEDIIALISLFQHLKDIKSLASSLHDRFGAILSGPQLIPADYSSWDEFQKYFGLNNNLADQMNSLDVSSVATEVATDVLDTILKNPVNKVLFKLLSSVANAVEEELPSPPITFNPNEAIIDAVIDDVTALETDLVTAFADLTGDIIGDAVSQVAEDLANPQNTYKNLTAGLETLVTQFEDDVIEPVLDWLDDVARSGPVLVQDAIDQDPLITVDLTALKDLLHLFGIGKKIDSTYTVSAKDTVFFPMAIVMWAALYTKNGKSISKVEDIDSDSLATAPGLLAVTTSKPDFKFANLAVNFVATEIVAGMWLLNANKKLDNQTSPSLAVFRQLSSALQVIRRICNTINVVVQDSDSDGDVTGAVDGVELAFAYGQLFLALLGLQSEIASGGKSDGGASAGWPTDPSLTDILNSIGALSTIGAIGYGAYKTATSNPSTSDIVSVTGQSLARAQGIMTFAWDFLVPADEDILPFFLAVIAFCPVGFVLQAGAVSGALGGPGDGFGSCPRNNGRGKGKGKGRP